MCSRTRIIGIRRTTAPFAFAQLLASLAPPAAAAADAVDAAQVRRALQRGVRAIKREQLPDGSWPARHHQGGETALATLALLQAGEPVDSPAVRAGLGYLRRVPDAYTYVVSLKILVFTQADPKRFRNEIQAAANWLVNAQHSSGLWHYTDTPTTFDHSNSQFALLALHAAANSGAKVPAAVWSKARRAVLASQNRDGGWSYRQAGESYGSMTAANVANLYILGATPATSQERGFRGGAAPNCGEYRSNRPLTHGLNWLGRHFAVDQNPLRGGQYLYYWLYGLERCGILSGRRYFGTHDWYRAGAAFLVRAQNADGSWGRGLVDSAFAVLFLAKGRKPLLIQKLEWSNDEAWTPDRHDVENLVAYIGDKLGESTAWQVVNLDAPLEEWLAAPLLYLQGHRFPDLSERQRGKLREFVEKGGTLLAEACCGRDEFRRGFESFITRTFPDQPLRALDAGHPLYSAHFDLPPAGLMGVDVGCRTSVIYSPNDLSCLWEQTDVPRLSEPAFQLGTNIAAFAVGRQALRDRLDVLKLPQSDAADAGPPPGGALRLAQVVYAGDWAPDAQALVHFAEFLRDQAQLDVITGYRPVPLDADDLYTCPVLYLTGHYAFRLSDRERAALAAHLRRGGFLLADACCGRAAFDESFRGLIAEAFPGERFERVPADHPLFRGEPGYRVERVGYKPALLAELPELDRPELWGLWLEGRLALVYSPHALGCGLDGHKCFNCRGLLDDDARRLAANIVLYTLTH